MENTTLNCPASGTNSESSSCSSARLCSSGTYASPPLSCPLSTLSTSSLSPSLSQPNRSYSKSSTSIYALTLAVLCAKSPSSENSSYSSLASCMKVVYPSFREACLTCRFIFNFSICRDFLFSLCFRGKGDFSLLIF